MTLVRGMTDILTPINLIPNSDFTKSQGFNGYQDIGTLSNGQTVNIAECMTLRPNKNITNLVVTRNVNTLTISGTIDTSDGEAQANGSIEIHFTTSPRALISRNLTYTSRCDCTPTQNISSVRTLPGLAFTNIYHDMANTHSFRIWKTSANSAELLVVVVPTAGTNVNFSFTISNVCLYEGSFCNPPITTGLDAKSGERFLLTDGTNFPYYYGRVSGGNPSGMWSNNDFVFFQTTTGGKFEYLFDAIEFTGGASNPAHPIHISVDMYVFGVGMWINLSSAKYNIEVHGYTAGATTIGVSSATITQDTSYPSTKSNNHNDTNTPAYSIRATAFKNVAGNPSLAIYLQQTNANAGSGYYHLFHVKLMVEPDAGNASTDTRKHTWYLLQGVRRMNSTTDVFNNRMNYNIS